VTIITYYKGYDVPGVDIRRTAPLPWRSDYEVGSSRHKLAFDLFLLAKVVQVGMKMRPHVVHGHMHEGALIGSVLARVLRVPLVFDFQGSLTGEMLDHGFVAANGSGFRFWRRLEDLVCRLPQAILTSSEEAQRFLAQDFQIARERIVPLPDCADLKHFSTKRFSLEEKAAWRTRLGIPEGRPVVAYLGLLANYQGTPHLLKAAAALKQQGANVHFLIMGYPNEDRYAAMAQQLGVADRVTLTGRVDYLNVAPRYLSLGDIAVSPKMSSTEGSGKVLNYMAMGQPVIAFDSPVHREYLGEWGVYVPPGDVVGLAQAIRSLIDDGPRRCRLGAGLRQRAAVKYDWMVAAEQISSLYQRLVKQNSVRITELV